MIRIKKPIRSIVLVLFMLAIFLITLIAFCYSSFRYESNAPLSLKEDIISVEEPIIRCALNYNFEDEDFTRSHSDSFASEAVVSSESDGDIFDYWSVEYRKDYIAIFVNLGNKSRVEVNNLDVRKKETIINNGGVDRQACVSIWLVSPGHKYDLIWYDPNLKPEDIRNSNGFEIHRTE